jgi:DnaJ family protein B protein 4
VPPPGGGAAAGPGGASFFSTSDGPTMFQFNTRSANDIFAEFLDS